MKKILSLPDGPPLQKNFKTKKSRHFQVHAEPFHDCMKFLFPKLFVIIFGVG
jgi:hypothetical protein